MVAFVGCGAGLPGSGAQEHGPKKATVELSCRNAAHPAEGLCVYPVRAGMRTVRVAGTAGMPSIKKLSFNGKAVRRTYTVSVRGTTSSVGVPRLRPGMLIVGAVLTDGTSRVAHVTVKR
jgi:hypothetical protein